MSSNLFSGIIQRSFEKFYTRPSLKGVRKSAYKAGEQSRDFLLITEATCRLASAFLDKEKIYAALMGSSALSKMESVQDSGYCLRQEDQSFFSLEKTTGAFNLYRPIEAFDPSFFDVALLIEGNGPQKDAFKAYLKAKGCLYFDLFEMCDMFRRALNSIKSNHFYTCLNPNKLAAVFLAVYFCPPKRQIAEIGSYRCGTTIFMAKLLQIMMKHSLIYAFDTFEGMPEASAPDKKGIFCFDSGMFSDNNFDRIKKRIEKERVLEKIHLCKGLVQATLPEAISNDTDLFFAFIDTDQYAGTKAGLENVLCRFRNNNFLIIVDDPIVVGVDQAIKEVLELRPDLKRRRLFANFELILPKSFPIVSLL